MRRNIGVVTHRSVTSGGGDPDSSAFGETGSGTMYGGGAHFREACSDELQQFRVRGVTEPRKCILNGVAIFRLPLFNGLWLHVI